MKGFSRSMPPAPVPTLPPLALVMLVLLTGGLLLLVYQAPLVLIVFVALGVVTVVLNRLEDRQLDRIEALRPEESICTFARSFERHTVDPWIIRAVWQEFQTYFGNREKDFPMRATDRIEEDLRIDEEDLGAAMEVIAFRANRSSAQVEQNPLFGQIKTVGDVVWFMNHQPELGQQP